jgi:prepilin-type N-terminal cleavage/methylation domain-containing protein
MRKLRIPVLHKSQGGFTIVEFMIATMVFSVILMAVTSAILYMTKAYQHSLYTSRTQAAASSLIDTLTQSIKYNTNTGWIEAGSEGSAQTKCIGGRQIIYILGHQLDGADTADRSNNVMLIRQRPGTSCPLPSDSELKTGNITNEPKELLGKGMRLVRLDMVPEGNMQKITVKVAYGDRDLFCSPSVTSCDNETYILSGSQLYNDDLMCRPGAGSEFCAISELSSTIYQRL